MARTSFVDVALRLRGAKRFNAEVAASTKQLEAMGVKGAASMGAFAQKAGRFKHVGRQLTTGLTLPIVAASGAAVKMSMDYNSSFGKIERLVGINRDQLDTWKGEILDLSRTTAKAPKDLADAMFFVTSAGLRGETAMQALSASAKAAASGLGETEAVADAVTSAMNAYGPNVLSASQATDVLLATVREGKMEADELAPVIGRVIPIAEAMGVSFDQAAGSMAVMSKSGTNAATAAVQTSAILTTFAKPTGKMTDALDQMGLSLDQVRTQLKNKGLVPTIAGLREQAKRAGVDLADVFGNKRALNGVLQLTKNGRETAKVMRGVAASTGATDEAFDKLEQAKGFQLNKALNELRVTAIEVGQEIGVVVLPVLTKAIQAIGAVFRWVGKLPKALKVALLVLVGLAAALGPAIWLLGSLAKSVGAILIILPKLIAFLKLAKVAMLGLNLAFLANPIVLVVVAIAALVGGLILAYHKVGWFRKAVDGAFSFIKSAANTVLTFFKKNWKTILIAMTGPVGIAVALIIKNWGRIKGAASAVIDFVKSRFTSLVGFFKQLPGKISSAVAGAFDGIKNAFKSAINFIIRAWNGLDLSISIAGKTISIGTPNIPELATGGTVTQPGMAMVGERGPELLTLPRGASVIPLSQSVASAGMGPQRIEVPVYLNGRQIALAVADEVSNARARA